MPRVCTMGMSLGIRLHEYQASRTISISVIHNIGVRYVLSFHHRFFYICLFFLSTVLTFFGQNVFQLHRCTYVNIWHIFDVRSKFIHDPHLRVGMVPHVNESFGE